MTRSCEPWIKDNHSFQPAPYQPTLAEDSLQNQVWNSQHTFWNSQHTFSQQPCDQPNPNVVPEILSYDDCQDDGAPKVPIGEQSAKKSSGQPSTESETEVY